MIKATSLPEITKTHGNSKSTENAEHTPKNIKI